MLANHIDFIANDVRFCIQLELFRFANFFLKTILADITNQAVGHGRLHAHTHACQRLECVSGELYMCALCVTCGWLDGEMLGDEKGQKKRTEAILRFYICVINAAAGNVARSLLGVCYFIVAQTEFMYMTRGHESCRAMHEHDARQRE